MKSKKYEENCHDESCERKNEFDYIKEKERLEIRIKLVKNKITNI